MFFSSGMITGYAPTPKQQAAIRQCCDMCKRVPPERRWVGAPVWYHDVPGSSWKAPHLRCDAGMVWEAVHQEYLTKAGPV